MEAGVEADASWHGDGGRAKAAGQRDARGWTRPTRRQMRVLATYPGRASSAGALAKSTRARGQSPPPAHRPVSGREAACAQPRTDTRPHRASPRACARPPTRRRGGRPRSCGCGRRAAMHQPRAASRCAHAAPRRRPCPPRAPGRPRARRALHEGAVSIQLRSRASSACERPRRTSAHNGDVHVDRRHARRVGRAVPRQEPPDGPGRPRQHERESHEIRRAHAPWPFPLGALALATAAAGRRDLARTTEHEPV